MYTDKAMEADALKDLIAKKSKPGWETRGGGFFGRRAQVEAAGVRLSQPVAVGLLS